MDNLGGSPVYYKDGSWFHRIKELTDTLEIVYSEKGGFKTEEDAAESYVIELGTFKRKMDILKERQGNLYFKDYLIYWFHKVFIPRSSNITNVVSSYTLYNFLLPSITEKENIQIQFVTVSMVDKILSKSSVFSETSGEQTQKLLSAVFYDAQIDGLIKENSNPMKYTKKIYRKTPRETVIFTKEQLKKFLDYTKKFSIHYLEFMLALVGGLRHGEIRGLRFSDCSFENRTLHIRQQITRQYDLLYSADGFRAKRNNLVEKPPKSDCSERLIRVHPVIFQLLEQRKNDIQKQKAVSKKWNEQYEDYICIGKAGNIKSDSTLNSALSNICTNTGLPKITCHSLRHMCATLMFESGGDLLQVAKFLGHANPHTTFDIYVNHMESYGNLKNQLNERFDPFPLIDGGLSYAEKIV